MASKRIQKGPFQVQNDLIWWKLEKASNPFQAADEQMDCHMFGAPKPRTTTLAQALAQARLPWINAQFDYILRFDAIPPGDMAWANLDPIPNHKLPFAINVEWIPKANNQYSSNALTIN